MIYFLSGILAYVDETSAVVDCGGVGYKCFVPLTTVSKLPKVGSKVVLYTYMAVREDDVSLYGFSDEKELRCFKMLITVSGVGPKAALAILSQMDPQALYIAIASSDVKSITKAQGVGPKVAQRVVLELKDKITNDSFGFGSDESSAAVQNLSKGNMSEARSALSALGYSQSEAAMALKGASAEMDTQELIKLGLKNLSKR